MKDIEFYTQYGKTRPTGTKETFTKPSLTEPDNALSIPQIIARFTRGQGYGVPVHDWTGGSAPEEGEETPQDETVEKVLGIESQPAPASETVSDPEPSPEPTPAPAGE